MVICLSAWSAVFAASLLVCMPKLCDCAGRCDICTFIEALVKAKKCDEKKSTTSISDNPESTLQTSTNAMPTKPQNRAVTNQATSPPVNLKPSISIKIIPKSQRHTQTEKPPSVETCTSKSALKEKSSKEDTQLANCPDLIKNLLKLYGPAMENKSSSGHRKKCNSPCCPHRKK